MYLQIYIGLQGSACWFVGFGFVSFNKNPYQNISRKSAKLQLSCLMPTDGRTESYNELIIDFSNYQLNAQFFYFSTIYMLHYAPQHVSNSTLLILRRTKCITTASGIVTLQTPAYCTAAYRGWRYQRLWWYNWSSWGWAACCSKHVEERSVTYTIYCWKIKYLWIKLVIWKVYTMMHGQKNIELTIVFFSQLCEHV